MFTIFSFMYKIIGIWAMICCLLYSTAKAQDNSETGSLTGTIIDTISHNLDRATITLMNAADTSKIKQTLSDNQGRFSFSNLTFDTYILRVSFQGYEVMNRYVSIAKSKPNVALGDIKLQQKINDNGTVVVVAVVPITLKGDTTEYNAAAFGIKPNGTTEDLLKKLPGVEVDKNGNISSNGESVTRVFVDGKRFFGNDPKLATQNLPAEVIDKVQVFDGKSDQSEFSGFDDGTTIKTINIVTRPDRRHGWFGKSSIGGGDELDGGKGLYDANARIAFFHGKERIMFLGQLNNINEQFFTRGDQSNNNGITKTATGGINYANTFGKTDFSGSYFYNNINTTALSVTNTQKLYSDTSQNTNSYQTSNNWHSNINHRINLNFDTKFDTLNELRIRPNINFTNANSNNSSETQTWHPYSDNNVDSISRTIANTSSKNNGYNGTIGITYNHKFAKKGRTATVDIQLGGSNTNASGTNMSNLYTFSNLKDSITNQQYHSTNNSKSISTTLDYTEPITQHHLIKIEYNNSLSHNTSNYATNNFNAATGAYDIVNDLLTNQYNNNYNTNRATLSYMYAAGKANLMVSDGVQFGDNYSNNLTKNYTISQHYINMYPSANFMYRFSNAKELQINYQGRTTQPSMSQLQPLENNADPMNITSGNPDLKQEFTHTLLLRYRATNRATFKSFAAFFNASYTTNNITNAIWQLSNGGDSSRPVNFGNSYNLFGYVNWSFPLSKSIFNFATRINASRSAGLVNDTANYTTTATFQETIKWSTNLQKNWDINISTTPAYNIANYKFAGASQSPNKNANYYSQSIIFDGTWYDKKGWELASTFNYTFYRGNAPGANASIPLWTASVGKLFFKNRAGEIKLSMYDVLNQNKGISFIRSSNVISQTQTNILKRYLLLTFTYNLRQFGRRNNGNGHRSWRQRDDVPPPPPPNGEAPPPPPPSGYEPPPPPPNGGFGGRHGG